MKDYLIMNSIIADTHPGYLFHSMGNYFPHHILNRTKNFKFFIKLCDKDSKYVYKVFINSFTNKSLCLINS